MSQQFLDLDFEPEVKTTPEISGQHVFVSSMGKAARMAALQACPGGEQPLVLAPPSAHAYWRTLSQELGRTLRLEAPETYFSRIVRQHDYGQFVTLPDRLLILADVLEAVQSSLHVLREYALSSEFCREFALLVGDLRRSGLTRIPSGGDWSADLQIIWSAYQARLRELGAQDVESIPSLVVELARQEKLPRFRSLILELPLDTSPAVWNAVQVLSARAMRVLVPLVIPGLPDQIGGWAELEPLLEGHAVEPLARRWREVGASMGCIGHSSVRTQAAAKLLGWAEEASAPEHLVLTAAHDPWDEMSRMASTLRRSGLNASVAVPDAARYGGVLEAAFRAHGLQAAVARSRSVAALPLTARLLRVLSYDPRGVELDDLLELYGDDMVRAADEERCLNPRRLRAACRVARVTRLADLESLEQRFRDTEERLRSRYEEKTLGERLSEQYEALKACLEHGDLECLRALSAAAEARNRYLRPREWADLALNFLHSCAGHLLPEDETEVEEQFATPEPELEPWQIEAANQYRRVQNAIESVVERAARWAGDRPRRGGDYGEWLRVELDAGQAVDTAEGVPVSGLQSLESGSEGCLFMAGLLEGDWPASNAGSALASRHGQLFAEIQRDRPTPAARGLYQLTRVICEAEQLFLSYPTFQQGKETLRSPLVEDLIQAWPGHVWPTLPGLEHVEPTARSQRLAKESQDSANEVNPEEADWLAHLHAMRSDRRNPAKLGAFDGVLGEAGPELMRRYFERRAAKKPEQEWVFLLSPTALERYAGCPLKFFFRDVLELAGQSSLDEDLPANEQGDLVHRILERFHREYRGAITKEEWEAAWRTLSWIAETEINRLTLRRILRMAEHRRLLGDGSPLPDGRSGGGVLARILEAEIEQLAGISGAWAQPLVPLARHFSSKDVNRTLEAAIQVEVKRPDGKPQRISGRIDRIDIAEDQSLVAIIDYKTGSKSNLASFRSMDAGQDFQLAIYLLELRRRYAKTGDVKLAAAFFVLQEAEFSGGLGVSGTLGRKRLKSGEFGASFMQSGAKELAPEEFEAWLNGIAARAGQIGQLIEDGVFNITLLDPKAAKCRFCECQSLCGYNADLQPERADQHAGSVQVYAPKPLLTG